MGQNPHGSALSKTSNVRHKAKDVSLVQAELGRVETTTGETVTDIIEDEIVPERGVSSVRGLAAQGAALVALLFATVCGFFFSMDIYVIWAVVLTPLLVVAAWIIWRELDRRAWLAMLPAVIISFLVFATHNGAPWYSVFYANAALNWSTSVTGGPTIGDMAGRSFGRLVLLVIMFAICVVIAEAIQAFVNRPAQVPMIAPEVPVGGTGEVLKQVGTTEDGRPLYVTVTGPGIGSTRQDIPRTNVLSVLALVFGLIGGLPAIPLGHIALHQIKRTRETGRGMAIAGLVLGYAWTGTLVTYGIIVAVAVARMR